MTIPIAIQADWQDISRLLDEVLVLPSSAQGEWLDALSGADSFHRETLRALLLSSARLHGSRFLDTLPHLPVDSSTDHLSPLLPGRQVGPYRLLKQLGRGGMASVWLAERTDGLVERQVALKLPHTVWGNVFAERLARERQILAGLEHPNIARFYDTGLDEQGRPWIAMEYV